MKNYDQSKKKKEEFLEKEPIAHYMLTGDPTQLFLREQLALVFETNDRQIRLKVAELANYVPILSLSKDKGYRVLSFNEETPIEALEKMLEEIQHQVNEFRSRIDNLKARMKPLIALQKVIEKKLNQDQQQ